MFGSGSSSGFGTGFLSYGGFPVCVGCACIKVRVPQRFSGGGGGVGGVVPSMVVLRLALVFLFALGKYLVCPLVGFLFQVGDCVGGRGSTAGRPLPLGCGGAGSSSDRLWRVRLEVSPSCPPPTRLPIFVQGFKSISVRALGWWMMRLHQDLGSVGGRFGGVGFDCAPAAPPGGSEPRWKMNRASRGFYVIFFFFEVLCVSLGGALCSSFFNIPSLSQKKM